MKYKLTKLIAVSAILTSSSTGASVSIDTNPTVSIDAKKKAKPYPLKTCVVSSEALGSMGEYISFVYKDQTIKVCCKPCIKKFKKNPKKYLKILAEKAKKKSK